MTKNLKPKGKTMKRRLTTKLLLAGLAVAPLATTPIATATAQTVSTPEESIVVSIGRGQLISVPGQMSDVFVANDSIADVQVKSQRQLYVFGKSGGETTIYASNARGDVIWSANIRVGSNIESVDQMLALAMPDAKVTVATMGSNTLLVTGTVAAPEDAAEVERLVQAFVGDDTNVISRMRMATPLQVNLRVRFAEVSRSLVRDINANLTTRDQSNGFVFGANRGTAGNIVGDNPSSAIVDLDPCSIFQISCPSDPTGSRLRPFDIINQRFVTTETRFEPIQGVASTISGGVKGFLGLDLLGTLDLGETVGLVTTLSEPNLTALSGETAEFLAGGEFPIPTSQGLGSTSIEYRNFGVSLAYTPTVLSNGRISIRVRPEVSELSSQGAVTINGFQIPALTTRRAETTVELGSGQSFMIAGLMSNSAQNTLEKTPGLGDVPIIGNLFRSRGFRKGETELVIIVTPYLVEPVNANEIKLPTDGFNTANELQQFLGYQAHDGDDSARPGPTTSNNGDGHTPPNVGGVAPDAIAPRRAEDDESKDRSVAVATPGFNL